MIFFICCLVTLFACGIGTICGMGGGIIIKPVLDAAGILTVSSITFLSGCTVIAMTCWSVGKTLIHREAVIELNITTTLAVGAALGGLAGRHFFSLTASLFPNPDTAGGVQACLLLAATFFTLLYTLKKGSIKSMLIASPTAMLFIGLVLGILGSYLGIGGGPFNVAVLYYFFSMPAKKAAQNSLYIVLFSQTTGTMKTVLSDGIPDFNPTILFAMILCGILGSELGRRINKKLDDRQATHLFEVSMILIMGINIFNIYQFLF